MILNELARKILDGTFSEGDVVEVDFSDGEIIFQKVAEAEIIS